MGSVYIAGGLRTYIGAKNRVYRNIPAEVLAGEIIRRLSQVIREKGFEPEMIIAGNATGGGGNIARLSLLFGGLQDYIPGITIDAQCASGLESIVTAWTRIKSGLNSLIIAGGTESSSTKCVRSYNPNHPNYDSTKVNNIYESAQFIPEDFSEKSMIAGADEFCRKYGITSDELTEFVIESHKLAVAAKKCGILEKIIHPCFGAEKDELIRDSISEQFVNRLKPVLPNGIITPATSCLFSDGAAFIALSSLPADLFGSGFGYKIRAAVTCGGNHFLSPEILVEVIQKLIKVSGLKECEISRVDYNQAFACLDVLFKKNFSIPSNELGGALAYGHPYGASGGIVVLHLLCSMEKNGEKYGIAAIPGAGGIGSAVLIEREKL